MTSDTAPADASSGEASSRINANLRRVRVALADRAYEVLIGPGLIRSAISREAIARLAPAALIITDETVDVHHGASVRNLLETAGVKLRGTVAVPAGERSKSFDELKRVAEAALASGLERRDVIIALGGGVVGDLAGFVAAIVRRGVDYVQIPTTLLAQVDSSVGGKTAVNVAAGKNLIGAFHQPRLVVADTDLLATLGDRDFAAGYAEVAKYGLLGDASFFDWLDANRHSLRTRQTAALVHAVTRSVEMKAEIVARDETETGDRALLNLGHTFGHALEAWAGYSGRRSGCHRHVPCFRVLGTC